MPFDASAPARYGLLSLLFAAIFWVCWQTYGEWAGFYVIMWIYLGLGLLLWGSYLVLWLPGMPEVVQLLMLVVHFTMQVLKVLITIVTIVGVLNWICGLFKNK